MVNVLQLLVDRIEQLGRAPITVKLSFIAVSSLLITLLFRLISIFIYYVVNVNRLMQMVN